MKTKIQLKIFMLIVHEVFVDNFYNNMVQNQHEYGSQKNERRDGRALTRMNVVWTCGVMNGNRGNEQTACDTCDLKRQK